MENKIDSSATYIVAIDQVYFDRVLLTVSWGHGKDKSELRFKNTDILKIIEWTLCDCFY